MHETWLWAGVLVLPYKFRLKNWEAASWVLISICWNVKFGTFQQTTHAYSLTAITSLLAVHSKCHDNLSNPQCDCNSINYKWNLLRSVPTISTACLNFKLQLPKHASNRVLHGFSLVTFPQIEVGSSQYKFPWHPNYIAYRRLSEMKDTNLEWELRQACIA